MGHKVDNAIIMAAGTASRFAPLSYEKPKALIEVKGEILIERQINQLKAAGIQDIFIVVGYKKEHFTYLSEKYGVKIIENNDYLTRNNNASIYAVRKHLRNSYICSSDNYFSINPFESEVDTSYYAGVYAAEKTAEWCMFEDDEGYIKNVVIGGQNSWYMLGHTFWTEEFSKKFIALLESIYHEPATADLLWESIFINHLDTLKMKIRKYADNTIFEFDTLDELRTFDQSYVENTRSKILKTIAKELNCKECNIKNIEAYKDSNNIAAGFTFCIGKMNYIYDYNEKKIRRIK